MCRQAAVVGLEKSGAVKLFFWGEALGRNRLGDLESSKEQLLATNKLGPGVGESFECRQQPLMMSVLIGRRACDGWLV